MRYISLYAHFVLALCIYSSAQAYVVAVAPHTVHAVVQAQSAAAFLDSFGINTHMGTPSAGPSGTNYGNPAAIAKELQFVGIKHVRDDLSIGSYLPALKQLHSEADAKFDLTYGYYASDGGSTIITNDIANVQSSADMIEAIEGPNEPDEFGVYYNGSHSAPDGSTGAGAIISTQELIYSSVKGNAHLHNIPVYCPAFSYPAWAGPNSLIVKTANLAAYCDVAPLHAYVENPSLGVYPTYQFIQKWASYPDAMTAVGRPEVITEGGWATSINSPTGVDAPTQAKYIIEYWLDAFSQGIPRTYLYQLTDDVPNPPSNLDINNYGLFYYNGAPKPVATALHNLQSLLQGTAVIPQSLAYSVQGLPANTGHQLLMQKSDGAFVLALWNEGNLWNGTTHTEIPMASVTVSLALENRARTLQVYDPYLSLSPQQSATNIENITVFIPDHPIFVVIRR